MIRGLRSGPAPHPARYRRNPGNSCLDQKSFVGVILAIELLRRIETRISAVASRCMCLCRCQLGRFIHFNKIQEA
jgi:hypothetical protein